MSISDAIELKTEKDFVKVTLMIRVTLGLMPK